MTNNDVNIKIDDVLDIEFYEDEGFKIDNDEMADWALRKIKKDEEELNRLNDIAEAEISRLKALQEANVERFNQKTERLKNYLFEYFRSVEHKETKTQESYKLLSGSLILKKASTAFEKDDEALVGYLKKNGFEDMIKTVETPKWADFKKRLQVSGDKVVDPETGEVVDGITVVEKPESFDVKL